MRMRGSVWLAGAASALLLVACSHQERKGNGRTRLPGNPGEVAVEASVASVLLADDCQTAQAPATPPAIEAAAVPAKVAQAPASAIARPPGDVGAVQTCQQSTLQLALTGGPTGTPSRVEVVKVRMLDIKGTFLQELTPRNPQLWSNADSKYLPWNSLVSPAASLNVSFDLSAPDWAKIGNGDAWTTRGMGFKLEVIVRVSGAERTVEFTRPTPEINRDPPVPT
jgi:hypothetical protein